MKYRRIAFLILPAFCFWAAGIFLSWQLPARAAGTIGIKIMEKEGIGKYLADGNGISLYTFAKDKKNISTCVEGCAVNWPPFFMAPGALIEGGTDSDFTTIERPDGGKQTAYKGMPLYYFKNDQYPGDTFGQGLGNLWFLVIR